MMSMLSKENINEIFEDIKKNLTRGVKDRKHTFHKPVFCNIDNENNIQSGRALGELGHPDGPTVNLDRVSHKIVSLRESGSNFIGKAKILSTPMGKIASSLIEEGVKLGVSSRGIGSLKQTREGVNIVGDDFMLATAADIVADPSATDAFVEGIMEGKDWVWDGGILREKYAEKTYKQINTLVDQKQLDEQKLSIFNDFLSNL